MQKVQKDRYEVLRENVTKEAGVIGAKDGEFRAEVADMGFLRGQGDQVVSVLPKTIEGGQQPILNKEQPYKLGEVRGKLVVNLRK